MSPPASCTLARRSRSGEVTTCARTRILFWRPEEPDHKLAGRLRFNPTDGAILSFIEPLRLSRNNNTMSLTDLLGAQSENDDGIRLLGVAGSRTLTLDQCHLLRSSLQSHGFIQRRYQVNTILTGAHLGTEVSMRFASVSVQLGDLASWVGRSGLSVDWLSAEAGKPSGIRLTYESVPSIRKETDDGSITVAFSWQCQLNPLDKSMVEHKCAFEYRFRVPESLSRIMAVCSSLRNLVTICAHAPSGILDTKLTHDDLGRPIDLYTKWIGAGVQKEQNEDALIRRTKIAFSLDDIGSLEGIRSWLMLEKRCSVGRPYCMGSGGCTGAGSLRGPSWSAREQRWVPTVPAFGIDLSARRPHAAARVWCFARSLKNIRNHQHFSWLADQLASSL